MTNAGESIRLTVAQAIVRWRMNQFIEIDGQVVRICGGTFGIFGHGNVPCLGEALYPVHEEMPLYRERNEQSMGFAAVAYATYHLRCRLMLCTASAGPGSANLLTAVASPGALAAAFLSAKAAAKTNVTVMQVDPHEGWTDQGHAWWEIGTAEVADSTGVRAKHAEVEAGRTGQRWGIL